MNTVINYFTEIYAELPLDYIGDVVLSQTAFVLNLLLQWLDIKYVMQICNLTRRGKCVLQSPLIYSRM